MLKRKVINQLKDKKEILQNKCLLVSGPRQVGKTYSVREFAKEYASFVELNFIENNELNIIFEGNISSNEVISAIGLFFPEFSMIEGDTLIFLDEIQECPNAISALKFLAMDDRIHVIASGSMLGISYKNVENRKSYPVGYVDYIDMYALDFEEFLWAHEIDEAIIDTIKEHLVNKTKVPLAIHKKMFDYLKSYIVIGGMPEAVDIFIRDKDYKASDTIIRRIYRDYVEDIARYARPEIKIKAEKCYKSIPLQLSKENHKFQYSVVEHKGSARKFESSLDWLVNADIVRAVRNVGFVEYPLKAHAYDDNLRIYPTDIGMLIATFDYGLKKSILMGGSFEEVPTDIVLRTAKGGIYEALIADMFIKSGKKDLFFYRSQQGTSEIEFLIEDSQGVVPVEVKAGRKGSKSLSNILKKEDIKYGIKLSYQNIGQSEKILTLPLYMAAWL